MIPFANPNAAYTARKQEILAALERVLDSGIYILGDEVERFEAAFAAFTGAEHAIGCANGTDAIELILRAAGIGPSDAVFTVSHTAVATIAAIERCGATPILVDIDKQRMTMCPVSLERSIAFVRKTYPHLRAAAVIPVHLYGTPCDMDAILALAARYELFVLEDCAQAHGAKYKEKSVGTLGHAASFSFYPTKNLGALGDAGGCVCASSDLATAMRSLRQYGWRRRYISDMPGINSRLDPVQVAILCVQLQYLEQDNARRREIAAAYKQKLTGVGLALPAVPEECLPVYHLYVVRTAYRDDLMAFLQTRHIGTAIHYPEPVHTQPAYQKRIITDPAGLPVTEKVCPLLLSLPMFPQLSDHDVNCVCQAIVEWANQKERGGSV